MATESFPATVIRAWDETAALRGLVLDAGDSARAQHTTPGQYLKVRGGDGSEGFFALANAPGEPLELLLKRGAAAADALALLQPGDKFTIAAPAGKGYPVDEHAGKDLLLFAAGSGIAPLRAVVHHVLRDRARWGKARVYHGHRSPSDFAYAGEQATWTRGGVELHQVVSGPNEPWAGLRGYVQDVLRADPPPLGNAVAYVCGMKTMVAGVTSALGELGLPAGRIFLNF